MPREPRTSAFTWSPIAALIEAAGPMPGEGTLWVFDRWDPSWWPVAANDPN